MLNGHTASVNDLLLLPNGQLASASDDNTVRIWNTETGKLVKTLRSHKDYVTSLAMPPGASDFFSGSRDKTVRVWSS